MQKRTVMIVMMCLLCIMTGACGESVVPGYPVSERQSEDIQVAYLAVRTAAAVSTGDVCENIRMLRAVADGINVPAREEISIEYTEDGSKVSLVYQMTWKNQIRVSIVSGERKLTELIEKYRNEQLFFGEKEGYVTLQMNTLSYAVPEEKIISSYQGIYTNTASITFLSPYVSDAFEDAEIVLFDCQHIPPAPLTLSTWDENGEEQPLAVLDLTDGTISFTDLTDSGIVIFPNQSGEE